MTQQAAQSNTYTEHLEQQLQSARGLAERLLEDLLRKAGREGDQKHHPTVGLIILAISREVEEERTRAQRRVWELEFQLEQTRVQAAVNIELSKDEYARLAFSMNETVRKLQDDLEKMGRELRTIAAAAQAVQNEGKTYNGVSST